MIVGGDPHPTTTPDIVRTKTDSIEAEKSLLDCYPKGAYLYWYKSVDLLLAWNGKI